MTGILRRHHDLDAAVRAVHRRVLVHVDLAEAVVEALEPVVRELEVPEVALGRRERHDQRLVLRQLEVAVVVGDVRIAAGGEGLLVREARQLVRMLLPVARPTVEEPRGAGHELGDALEHAVEAHRVERPHLAGPTDALDLHVCEHFVRVVEARLADLDHARLGLHRQPVHALRLLLEDAMISKLSARAQLHVLRLEVAGGVEAAGGGVVARLRAEAEVVHRAARAPIR